LGVHIYFSINNNTVVVLQIHLFTSTEYKQVEVVGRIT